MFDTEEGKAAKAAEIVKAVAGWLEIGFKCKYWHFGIVVVGPRPRQGIISVSLVEWVLLDDMEDRCQAILKKVQKL